VVVVVEVVVVAVVVVGVVSVDVVVDAGVVSVVVGGGVVSVVLDDDAGAVSVVPDEDVLLPATLPRAPAARRPITNKATIATVVHAFFCGPPFFASGAIYLPSLSGAVLRIDLQLPQSRWADAAVAHATNRPALGASEVLAVGPESSDERLIRRMFLPFRSCRSGPRAADTVSTQIAELPMGHAAHPARAARPTRRSGP
jgi:hypothetical protein